MEHFVRLNRRSQTSLSTERIRKRLRLALHRQQHTALSREEHESEELLPMGSWAVPGELQCAAGEGPQQAPETSATIKQGPDGQRLEFGPHLLSEKNQ